VPVFRKLKFPPFDGVPKDIVTCSLFVV